MHAKIAGSEANAEIQGLARQVAEAQIDLRRIRSARHQFLCNALSDPYFDSQTNTRDKTKLICDVLVGKGPEITMADLEEAVLPTPRGPEKLALILQQGANRLLAMDRYERRALSRRKFAIRALDQARQQIKAAIT